ncbi:hypothetical protein [Actinomyces radicidentis]|uniref:hypothetical protein n=1 Tax=Actinomyces radicidentis TaxID=111015 RepID=UPI0026DFAE66|nr:hypothetical protein [Actinomyces radicidentis]
MSTTAATRPVPAARRSARHRAEPAARTRRARSTAGTPHPLLSVLRSGLTDRSWLVFLLVGAVLTTISALGNGTTLLKDVAGADQAAVDDVALRMTRLGFALLLFVSMWSATRVTSDFHHGTVTGQVARHGGVARLMARQALAALPGGLAFGVVGVLTGAGTAAVMLHSRGLTMSLDESFWRTVLGVVLVSVLAAPWGTCFGWLLRRTVPTVLVLVAWTTFIEPVLITWVPVRVGTWMPGNLQTRLCLDPTVVGDAGAVASGAALVGWVLLLGAVTVLVTRRRDLHG